MCHFGALRLSKLFLKFNQGELKLRVNDILNQNVRHQPYNATKTILRIQRGEFAVVDTRYSPSHYSLTKAGLGGGERGDVKIITG